MNGGTSIDVKSGPGTSVYVRLLRGEISPEDVSKEVQQVPVVTSIKTTRIERIKQFFRRLLRELDI